MNIINPFDINKIEQGFENDKFKINQNGEFFSIVDGKNMQVSNYSVFPIKSIYQEIDGSVSIYKYVFTGYIYDGFEKEIIPQFEVLHSELSSAKWLKKNIPLGSMYVSDKKGYQAIKEFILVTIKQTPKIIEVQKSGWHTFNNDWIYLCSNEAFGKIANQQVITQDTSKNFLETPEGLGDKQAYINTLEMLSICDAKLTHSLLGLLLLSLVTTPLMKNDLSPNFVLWIYGRSGLGKTTLASSFTQIFEFKQFIRIDDYRNDLRKALVVKDAVSIFDDFGIAKSNQTRTAAIEKAESILRWVGDRKPQTASSITPEGMTVITGETFLPFNEENTSSINRVIRVKMDNIFNEKESGFDPCKLERYRKYSETSYLAKSIKGYLNWIAEKLNSNFFEEYEIDFKEMNTKLEGLPRHKEAITHLIVSFRFYLAYGQEQEFLSPGEFAKYNNYAENVFQALLIEQEMPVINPDIEVFFEIISDLVKEEKFKVFKNFIPIREDRDMLNGILEEYEGKITLSVNWNKLYEAVADQAENLKKKILTKTLIGKLLSNENLIDSQNDNRSAKPMRALGGRALQLRIEKMTKIESLKHLPQRIDEQILKRSESLHVNEYFENQELRESPKESKKRIRKAFKEANFVKVNSSGLSSFYDDE
ncbi:DUF927 domain-containing protein [Saccharibacillus brassicae]|uniref:DUF927 domain-containing protein n=1 Tax=Saccharibacillus brassicae TaxID=2583377 RepID=A0A4Y6UUW4_SACBS|nr:DUF927 domain-containing protein [Saccharibacillus brassicae]QDH19795.1 DUF927 domain-containing protein [Saccharibacillus brassicae]